MTAVRLLAPASPAQVSPAEAAAEPADRYRDILARILSGLLVLVGRDGELRAQGRGALREVGTRTRSAGPDVELFGMVAPGK